jgi:hypothetical protein
MLTTGDLLAQSIGVVRFVGIDHVAIGQAVSAGCRKRSREYFFYREGCYCWCLSVLYRLPCRQICQFSLYRPARDLIADGPPPPPTGVAWF